MDQWLRSLTVALFSFSAGLIMACCYLSWQLFTPIASDTARHDQWEERMQARYECFREVARSSTPFRYGTCPP